MHAEWTVNKKFNMTNIRNVVLTANQIAENDHNWPSSRENLSSGFPTRSCSNKTAELQRQARRLKFV